MGETNKCIATLLVEQEQGDNAENSIIPIISPKSFIHVFHKNFIEECKDRRLRVSQLVCLQNIPVCCS